MKSKYQNQDRGTQTEYQQYLEAMDAISIEKVASASLFFEPKEGNTIVDVGMASGTSSAILADLFPHINIIGVDINPKMVEMAKQKYQSRNLVFRQDDGETLKTFEPESINGFFNCSSIHHITSYNGYDKNRAINTIKRQYELLKDKGVIVIRDFVKPVEQLVVIRLRDDVKPDRPNDIELLMRFAREARSLAKPSERGFQVVETQCHTVKTRNFRLFLTDATEFVRRKDYFENWDIELQEEYGYFTQKEFEQLFRDLGLRIILSAPIYNPWIINNRYRHQFELFTPTHKELPYPPTNYIIAGEKVSTGKYISLVRHIPVPEKPFLEYSSYKNTNTKEIYDLVSRPNEVQDILPYYKTDNNLYILAKQAYPRPLAALEDFSPNIDGTRLSGYITETISIAKADNIVEVLKNRFGIESDQYNNIQPGISYYTSPGGINEKVSSLYVELNQYPQNSKTLLKGFTGFHESGNLNCYDALQLLKSAQTGVLPEARLELNIYNLLNQLNIKPTKWIGEEIFLKEGFDCNPTPFKKIFEEKTKVFEPSPKKAGFLISDHATFSEIGVLNSTASFEYVYPSKKISTNTLVKLPINMKDGILYLGLEVRDLPVPQNYTGNSRLITVPAERLTKDINSILLLERCITRSNYCKPYVKTYFELGKKYFPSIGVTPEQVYPYLIVLSEYTDQYIWVRASELYENIDKIEDAHLLIALMRIKHALDL